MDSSWTKFFDGELEQTQALNRRRNKTGFDRQQINFGSNDYLGLSQHPLLLNAFRFASDSAGRAQFGSGASPVIGGHTESHTQLDTALANLAGAPAALSFSSGYACNVGVVAALAGEGDLILSDQLNHASLIDGCRLSRARCIVYPHCDADAIAAELTRNRNEFRRALIVTESVFSMDGDSAPIQQLAAIARQFDAALVVDEAHATGVCGPSGGGMLEGLHWQESSSTKVGRDWPDRLVKLGTLSKALGSVGGFACGSQGCIDFLVNKCRSYLFSTALPGPVAAVAAQAVTLVPELEDRRQRLRDTSRYLREALSKIGWEVPPGEGPIIPVIVGPAETALSLSRQLSQAGMHVPAIRPPTVPDNASRLRISLTALHSDAEIEQLISALAAAFSHN